MTSIREFRDHVLELLEPLGPVSARSMFGGVGIYLDGTMFALITRSEVLYFRTDDVNRSSYEDAGTGPFIPFADGRMTMPYHEVPAEVMEDGDALCEWARAAVDAALRSPKKKKKAAKTNRQS